MGKLADRYWSDVVMRGPSNSDQLNRWAATRGRIAAIEAVVESARVMHDGYFGSGELDWGNLQQALATVEAGVSLRVQHNDGMSAADFHRRLADAEQRAAAAWAAVTELVQTDGRAVAMSTIASVTNGDNWHYTIELARPIGGELHVGLRVLLVAPLAAAHPANPDLLERASVELAEAYQRAKAEEQRQAEEKAADKATMKCQPMPDDRGRKTIGLCRCPDCGNADCWPHYLSWEKSRGVTLNADLHDDIEGWVSRCARDPYPALDSPLRADANPSTATPLTDTVTR